MDKQQIAHSLEKEIARPEETVDLPVPPLPEVTAKHNAIY